MTPGYIASAFVSHPAGTVGGAATPGPLEVRHLPKAKPVKKNASPRCHTCGKKIRIPEGWTALPAVRRHYWAKHRDVMRPGDGAGS